MSARSKSPQPDPQAPDELGERDTARRRRTRARLMDAAYRLFSEHGVNGTSIEAVADEAGFSRGAFYSNFESKTELFFALAEREKRTRLEDLGQRVTELLRPLREADGKPGEDVIENVLADVFALQPDNRQWVLMHSEFRLLALRDPSVAPRFLDSQRTFQRQLAAVVEAALGSVGLRTLMEPLHLTRVLVDQYESAMQEALLAGADDPEMAARDTVMKVLPPLVHHLTEVE